MTTEELKAAAGRNFRRALERSGLKQIDIVNRTGAGQGQVSNWIKRGVSAQYASAVAAMLGVKPGQISAAVHEVISSGELESGPAVMRGTATVTPAGNRQDRLERLLEALQESDLGVIDLALLHELVQRLSRLR